MKKILTRLLLLGGIAVAAVLLLIVIANAVTVLGTKDRVLTLSDLSDVEEFRDEFDCIIVLGASVRPGGTPSDMLRDRLEVGNELYFAGYSPRLLMSGDHMGQDYDEVSVMKRYATDAGIPADAVYLDHAGLSTYDSIWRLANIFHAKKVLIVTQSYHLYRALYLAKSFGIDAYGFSADLRSYRGQFARDMREILARVKDVGLSILKPDATYIGSPISFSDGGNSTDKNPFWTEESS